MHTKELMRQFIWAPKTYVQTDGLENIHNFKLKNLFILTYDFRLLLIMEANTMNLYQTAPKGALVS